MRSAFLCGEILSAIGQRHGVTGEAVRKTLKKHFNLTKKHGGSRLRSFIRINIKAEHQKRRCEQKWGHELAFHKSWWKDMCQSDREAVKGFAIQRANALKRGIEWSITFSEWLAIWQKSGKWDSRGRSPRYGLSRIDFRKGFDADNCVVEKGADTVCRFQRFINKDAFLRVAEYKARNAPMV